VVIAAALAIFGEPKRIVYFDPEIASGRLNLCVSEQELYRLGFGCQTPRCRARYADPPVGGANVLPSRNVRPPVLHHSEQAACVVGLLDSQQALDRLS